MRVLWLCNIVLPAIAKKLHMPESNKEGWLTGISEALLREEENKITLGICFPVQKEMDGISGSVEAEITEKAEKENAPKNGMDSPEEGVAETTAKIAAKIAYYGFYEDTLHPEIYDTSLEERLKHIVEQFKPDVIHAFGTEFPHTLAMAKICQNRKKLLISVQGICGELAKYYTVGLPSDICKKKTFRDWLKRDNIMEQQEKFMLRGANEKAALMLAGNIAGRTAWDRAVLGKYLETAKYYKWNETLRSNFYGKNWSISDCERYSVFVSQGNYPIKGLHIALRAFPKVLAKYPDAKMYVAGDKITAYGTLKEKIKIGTYGKYLLELIRQNHLEEQVVFLGRLDAEKMCERLLKSHVFLSASVLENSSNTVGEAMLLGVPVVSSEVGGVPSLMEGEKEGLFYPPEDEEALAGQIVRIFSDEGLADRLSKAGKQRAEKTHDARTNYERLLEIYHEINLCV